MNSVIKISISMESSYSHVDDVIYYRTGTPDHIIKWLWYFDYLAALVKVMHPRRNVTVYHGPQHCLLGEEWHEHRRLSLLKSRELKLRKLQGMKVEDDLFGLAKEFQEERISKIVEDIKNLKEDKYKIEEFPEYINKIKDYLK